MTSSIDVLELCKYSDVFIFGIIQAMVSSYNLKLRARRVLWSAELTQYGGVHAIESMD
jgi:hypothetical protein